MEKTAAFHGLITSRYRLAGPVLLAIAAMLLICLGPSAAQGAGGPGWSDPRLLPRQRQAKGRSAGGSERHGALSARRAQSGLERCRLLRIGEPGSAGRSGSGRDRWLKRRRSGAESADRRPLAQGRGARRDPAGHHQRRPDRDARDSQRGRRNPALLGAIGSVPLVEEVCGQTEELTGRSNALLGLLDTLDLANLLSIPDSAPPRSTSAPPHRSAPLQNGPRSFAARGPFAFSGHG